MDNPLSPLETLRQLKEMLDAGALTPTEFEALKQRLVLREAAPGAPSPSLLPNAPGPAEPPLPAGPVGPAAAPPSWYDVSPAPLAPARPPYWEPAPLPPTSAAPEPLPAAEMAWVADEFPAVETPPARNPLALVLSIGGLLALLALVLYLSLNRRPSEHLSSTSQTAADSLAAAVETRPRSARLALPVAAPETVRVAPARPAPRFRPRPAPAVRDSAAVPPDTTQR